MTAKQFPLISIALCTFNGERFLKEQLDSLVGQTYPNLEIIAVDDRSEDGTWDILKDYAERFPSLQIIKNTQNLGYHKNFEKALGLCKGDLIAISDQDDRWELEKLQTMQHEIGQNIMLYHDSEFMDENGMSMEYKMSEKFNFVKGADPRAFFFLNCVSGHSMIFRKSVLEKALPFPEKGFYDHWLAFVASHLGSIDYLSDSLVKYRQHSKNATDIIGTKTITKGLSPSLDRLERENQWLKICAGFQKGVTDATFSTRLYQQAWKRKDNYINLDFGIEIWKSRHSLLPILKKSEWSKTCFALRHIWGVKAKRIFKFS
ncbi:hypothetical protein P872_00845 [Rhodonellum psychrophilum GCM71 = DSM 17998]|uniref:Glycosyltransferase 2-like domain-containing protein n=2 Tax=Rhodonellum TaxID=336827 RepID=U5C2Q0_9BACT|nr:MULTISPECIES: glycosyltransferase family 2 protein [Rhodonellum]ERM84089.1 hypothetical protein P872_00845 [Rhodonellum psychrophilum GCM71 = DSM 17998]SDY41588.1 Glycosyl transferase family 2 [Rhodonellum ikkaensis]